MAEKKQKSPSPEVDLSAEDYRDLRLRLLSKQLRDQDYDILVKVLSTLALLKSAAETSRLRIWFLLQKIFGIKTEKKKNAERKKDFLPETPDSSGNPNKKKNPDPSKKRGGRNGKHDYPGAEKKSCKHETLKSGDICPDCGKGKLVPMEPAVDYAWKGSSPVTLTIFSLERFVCSLCSQSFTAETPAEAHGPQVDTSHPEDEHKTARCDSSATANAMVALLRYEYGVPNYRLAKIQGRLGLTLPEATQWRMITQAAFSSGLIFTELVKVAAEGSLMMNDDTKMQVLDIIKQAHPPPQTSDQKNKTTNERKSTRTSTIVTKTSDGREVILYFTGTAVAGENLKTLLDLRDQSSAPPIHMCDGSSQSLTKGSEVILVHCLTHARRKFYELYDAGKKDLEYVLDLFGKIYAFDAKTRDLSPEERMRFLKKHCQESVDQLKTWMDAQLEQKKVEPNSTLGIHINYCLKRWPELTRFLTVPGVPLTNDETERKIKTAIVHRKNSLFYKTEKGALFGDFIMSIVQTCYANSENAFDYLVAIQEHRSKVIDQPEKWLPWNWRENLS